MWVSWMWSSPKLIERRDQTARDSSPLTRIEQQSKAEEPKDNSSSEVIT